MPATSAADTPSSDSRLLSRVSPSLWTRDGARLTASCVTVGRLSSPGDTTVSHRTSLLDLPRAPRRASRSVRAGRSVARPGGLFLATLGAHDDPGWSGEWLGRPMYFSSHDADGNRRLLRAADFDLLIDDVMDTPEPDRHRCRSCGSSRSVGPRNLRRGVRDYGVGRFPASRPRSNLRSVPWIRRSMLSAWASQMNAAPTAA